MEINPMRGFRIAGRRIALPLGVLAAAPLSGGGQGIPLQSFSLQNFEPHVAAGVSPVHILREIRDPQTGLCWRLMSNPAAPAGPAQLSATGSEDSCVAAQREQVRQRFAIQAGDRVVVEEHTRTVDACLEAVALGPAAAGSSLNLRLKIGGKLVRAMAVAPGRAALLPSTEGKR
jgi:hypothetical protein